ncbi:hypothetical protein E2C01_098935 [Portunus trituberculatus]|uniref:Uncharacterized protein n=1 Tax=Portunus trituberculatus TaxID=210409 RepID=A0A5B7K466_PORTR|nr:hypothetical protein [Portunus trituberculatus]
MATPDNYMDPTNQISAPENLQGES